MNAPAAAEGNNASDLATLTAFRQACDDPTLPASTRKLLLDAHHALAVAITARSAERNRYRALFDAVPDPVSVIGWDGTVLDLNKAGIDAYQRPREDIIGQPIHFLNPDLPRDHMGPVRDTLSRGDTYVTEVTNMRADGTRFPVEVHSANFEFEGQPCIVAVARDMSRRAEAELRYRELMEMVDKGILVRNASGQITYANAAAVRMLNVEEGLSLQQELRPGRWRVVDEDGNELEERDLPSFQALRTGRMEDSAVLGFYNERLSKLTWLSVTSVPQFAPGSDKPHQVMSLFTNVTELKRDSALFVRVQALAHIGGWQWDAGRKRLYLSHEVQRILGCQDDSDSMEQMLATLADDDRERLRKAIDAALSGEARSDEARSDESLASDTAHDDSFDLELHGQRDDGQVFWARFIGKPGQAQPITRQLTGTVQDITQRKQAEETLRVQARTDPLTGLLNRDAILGELDARLADPTQARIAVLYIDLDRFKAVNDVLGHTAGDELLMSAAHRISHAVGTEGLIARFGGDEFLLTCNIDDDPGRPERIADTILDAFGDSFRFDSEEFTITASIGIARAPGDGETTQALIQNADAAMYDSKRRVRNAWQSFSPELAQSQQDRLRVETQLRRAADNNEFHLVYQPQVDLHHGGIVAAEALIRWHNEQLGEMRPDHFIAHAEATGDIVRIGSWALREACRQVHAWRDAGLGVVRVAVNVSYRQFLGDDLARIVRDTLQEFDLPGTALELEFTERVLIEDAPDTLKTFAALRAMGVMLTIDDFGEGYSALNYLRRLPIHGLKLSQLFVQGVPGNKSDVAICQAVAGIAHSLGLGLVAEGVESDAQRTFLLKLGVPVGQGFLFSPGLPADEFAQRLRQAGKPAATK